MQEKRHRSGFVSVKLKKLKTGMKSVQFSGDPFSGGISRAYNNSDPVQLMSGTRRLGLKLISDFTRGTLDL